MEEIREINHRLIDTVVDISNEDVDPTAAVAAAEGAEGIIVKCSFIAVALSPSLKSQYASSQMVDSHFWDLAITTILSLLILFSLFICFVKPYLCFLTVQSPIQPLHLLVPANYPNCSPILLDKFPVESRWDYEQHFGTLFYNFLKAIISMVTKT